MGDPQPAAESAEPFAPPPAAVRTGRRRRWPAVVSPSATRGLVAVVVFLVVWQLLATYVVQRSLFLVGPLAVFAALQSLWASGELLMHLQVSAREFALGFSAALVVGIPIGLLLGTSDAAKQFADPLLNGLFATPLIALAPLFILWFGVGETKTVVLVFILCVLPVVINTDAGVRSTDRQLLEAARSFGANRLQRFAMVEIPWALSFILTGIRLGIGRGLIGVVAGELFGSRAGVGFLILTSSQLFNTALVLGGVLIFAVAGVVLIQVMEAIGRRAAPWRHRSTRA